VTNTVRNQVFETNSSSSHSITIAADDVLDLSFDRESVRKGVISITPRLNGYGSEQFRYVTPEGKLGYLLIMAAGGEIELQPDVFGGEEIDIIPVLLQDEERAANIRALIDFVRDERRCEIRFIMDYERASSIYMSSQPIDLHGLLRVQW